MRQRHKILRPDFLTIRSLFFFSFSSLFPLFSFFFLILLLLPATILADRTKVSSTQKKANLKNRKICVTFDNLPADRNYGTKERHEINRGILDALKKHKARAAGFVIGDNIESDREILFAWLDEGHILGFTPFSGQDIDNVPLEIYFEDVARGKDVLDGILKSSKQKKDYFRFPFLHYGADEDTKTKVAQFLREYDISIVHASVVTEDFVYNLSLEKNINTIDSSKIFDIRDEYLSHLLERLAYSEMLAQELFGRPIKHILQLRANRLNGLFLDDLLTVLEKMGYKFISLKEALKDKAYSRPDAYFGSRGVSILERIKFSDPDLLPAFE